MCIEHQLRFQDFIFRLETNVGGPEDTNKPELP